MQRSFPRPGRRGDCFGWQLQDDLWVTHTFHGRLRSKCLFKGKLGVRRRWVWLSRAWTLRLGGPVGSLGTPAPDLTREQRAGVQGRGCQPVSWQRGARQELSLNSVLPCAALWGGGRVWAGSGPHEGRWRKPTGGAPAQRHDVLVKHRGGAHGWPWASISLPGGGSFLASPFVAAKDGGTS